MEMKLTILSAVISASLLWSGAPAGQSCTTRSCAPVAPPALARQVWMVTSDELRPPRSRVVGHRDCVGLPRRSPVSPPVPAGPLMVVTSGLLRWI